MTEVEAVESARRLAKGRSCKLGDLAMAVLVTPDEPKNCDKRFRERYLGRWFICFHHPEPCLDGERFFSVEDKSGEAEWVNAPPAGAWLLLAYPIAGIFYLLDWLDLAWGRLRKRISN